MRPNDARNFIARNADFLDFPIAIRRGSSSPIPSIANVGILVPSRSSALDSATMHSSLQYATRSTP